MTKRQRNILFVLAFGLILFAGSILVSTLGSRSVEVNVKEDLNSPRGQGVLIGVEQVIPTAQTVNHQILSTESKNIIFDQGDSMHFSAQDYKPLALKYTDIEYLDLIGVTLYKSSPENRKITGKIRDWRDNTKAITIECDKCKVTSGSFSNTYSFEIDPTNSNPPITLTYRLGPSKEIKLELTPPNDSHATVDIAFDDSSNKDNRWMNTWKKIKRKFNL